MATARSRITLAWLALATVSGSACGDGPAGPEERTARLVISADTVLIPALGYQRRLAATAFASDGQALPGAAVVWGSRDPSRVHALDGGIVVGRDYGEALVIARVGEVADTAVVQVRQVPEQMAIEGPDTLWTADERAVLTVTMVDSIGLAFFDPPDWTSSDSAVAIAYNVGDEIPLVRAQGTPGSALLTASLRGMSASFEVVLAPHPDHIYLEHDRDLEAVGDTVTLRAEVRDSALYLIPGHSIEFRSSDTTVARVTEQGLITVVGGGTVLVSAHSGVLSASVAFVIPHPSPPLGDLLVSPASHDSDGFGEKIRLAAFVDDGVNPPVSVPATWTSRNTSVASVSSFYATTRGNGSTWLVAEYDGRTDSVQVNVDRVPVELSFQGVPPSFSITFTSGMPVYPLTLDQHGGFYQDWFETTWTVRDPDVAKVTTSGILAVGEGSTWVVVELEGLTDSLHVTAIPQWDDDYEVTAQADLEYFAELGIERIAYGGLRIEETALTSLDGLESLRTVQGSVVILNNPSLADMSALENLEVVGGSITIQGNDQLAVALPGLRAAGGLSVAGNGLVEGGAFDALGLVGTTEFGGQRADGSVVVGENGSARVAFPVLERVAEDLTILNSSSLETFSAPLLWRATSVNVQGNSALTTLELGALSALVDDLNITGNQALVDLAGFGGLTSGLRRLRILENAALSELDGLRQLGDALGSDPIVWDVCEIDNNPSLSGADGDLLSFLEGKFPGGGMSACFR